MMEPPLTDLVQLFRKAVKTFKLASVAVIVVAAVILFLEVADVTMTLAAIQPWMGWLFAVVLLIGLVALAGPPAWRFLRVPTALRPPVMPPNDDALRIEHVTARLDHIGRYLRQLQRNPRLRDGRADLVQAAAGRAALQREVAGQAGAGAALDQVARFEHDQVEPLLKELDAETDRVIRQQALAVGAATAVSPYGAIDAFVVLWRNVNLVSRIANIYYGRPGLRGTVTILRDVSVATVAALYMEPASNAAAGLVKNVAGRTAGMLAGPLFDGAANAVLTLRIGYVARARCRCFEAWTEATRLRAARGAFAVAARVARGVLSDLTSVAGETVSQFGGRVGSAGRDTFSALWNMIAGGAAEEGEGRPADG